MMKSNKNILPNSDFNHLQNHLLAAIHQNGGWTNAHCHLDRAGTITLGQLKNGNLTLQQKWAFIDDLKRRSTVSQIYDRMARALENQLTQGVTAIATFIDVDSVIKDKAIQAASKIKERYQSALTLKFANQTLKGVLTPSARKWFELGAQFVDIIGSLPGKDHPHEAQHLDVILSTARQHQKLVHVHVDQLNLAAEQETRLLAEKTMTHQLIGQVSAIHSVSLACQPLVIRQKTYQLMKKAQLGVITCPTAWIDARRQEMLTPTHNAIAPVEELLAAGITVGLGTDNIADVYKPFTDGELWTELRFLLETCHLYDLKALTHIASSNGRRLLGLND